MNSQFKLLFSFPISSIFVSTFFILDPDSSFYLVKRHYMSDILFLSMYILFHISVIMFVPTYNVCYFSNFIMHQMCTRLYITKVEKP